MMKEEDKIPIRKQVRLWKEIPGNMMAKEPLSVIEVYFVWCHTDDYSPVEVDVMKDGVKLEKTSTVIRRVARWLYKGLRAEGYSVGASCAVVGNVRSTQIPVKNFRGGPQPRNQRGPKGP